MVWDDDEDYVPPVILNEQFMQEKLPMFGKDEEAEAQENADLFSKEQIKQYNQLHFLSRDWSNNQAVDIRNSIANMNLKFGNHLDSEEKDFGEVRGRGVTMAPTQVEQQREIIGQFGLKMLEISQG